MAKCPKCGADNPDYAFFCGKCSSDLRDASGKIIQTSDLQPEPQKEPAGEKAQPGGPIPIQPRTTPPQLIFCTWCGRQVNATTLYCPYCGKNPRGPWEGGSRPDYTSDSGESYEVSRGGNASGVLVLGGVMAILAGVLALGQGIIYATAASAVSYLPGSGSICFCGGLDALFGLGSIAGGIMAIRRSSFALALAGAIVGMLGLGLLIGGLFGLIALICIAVSRQEFND